MRVFEALKEDIEMDLDNGGNGISAAILGTGLGVAAIGLGVGAAIAYSNPYAWVALNFKDFATKFLIGDVIVSGAGVAATKYIASSRNEYSTPDPEEGYQDFLSMIDGGKDSIATSNTSDEMTEYLRSKNVEIA